MIQTVASAFEDRGFFTEIDRDDHQTTVAMMKSSTRIDWACYRVMDDSIVLYPGLRIPARLFVQLKEIDFVGAKFLGCCLVACCPRARTTPGFVVGDSREVFHYAVVPGPSSEHLVQPRPDTFHESIPRPLRGGGCSFCGPLIRRSALHATAV